MNCENRDLYHHLLVGRPRGESKSSCGARHGGHCDNFYHHHNQLRPHQHHHHHLHHRHHHTGAHGSFQRQAPSRVEGGGIVVSSEKNEKKCCKSCSTLEKNYCCSSFIEIITIFFISEKSVRMKDLSADCPKWWRRKLPPNSFMSDDVSLR